MLRIKVYIKQWILRIMLKIKVYIELWIPRIMLKIKVYIELWIRKLIQKIILKIKVYIGLWILRIMLKLILSIELLIIKFNKLKRKFLKHLHKELVQLWRKLKNNLNPLQLIKGEFLLGQNRHLHLHLNPKSHREVVQEQEHKQVEYHLG